ncbi:hypothetical protein Tco_1479360, partial [Tanacetum coccineum]
MLVLDKELAPMLDSQSFAASISGTTIASSYLGGAGAIYGIDRYQPSYLWEDCYLVSQDLVIQQKFVGLAVVDVYGLENDCACTK